MASRLSYSRTGACIGVIILIVGLILLLDQMGYVSAEYVFRFFWPSIFIFFGIKMAVCRGNPYRMLIGVLLALFGLFLLLGSFGILHVGLNTMWPLLLIIWGAWVIARAFGHGDSWDSRMRDTIRARKADWKAQFRANINQKVQGATGAGKPPGTGSASDYVPGNFADGIKSTVQESWNSWTGNADPGDSEFDHVAIFGGVKQRVTVKNFRGGRVLAICGGFEIDLTRADIDGQMAVIDANALMGGGEIRVPDTWVVEFRGVPLLGGYSDETHQTITDSTTAKRLVIKGIACMGGVVVKN